MEGNGAPYRRNRPPVHAGLLSMYKFRNQVQEQIQIIATAIGKPAAKAPTIINVNSESKFVPGRASPTNMPIFSAADFELKCR